MPATQVKAQVKGWRPNDVGLRESEARFRRLFETAQDGILILDAETGKITEVNRFLLDLLGYAREEILGKKLWELGFLKDVEASKEAFEALQRTGYARYDDLPLETKDGRHMEVEFISNAYQVDTQRVIQCNIRDASERKRVEHFKDDFLSTVSHEIRTPLSVLKMGIDNLEAGGVGQFDKEKNETIAVLKRNAQKLGRLIDDLLDLSRFESGRMKIAPQEIQIDTLIEEVVQEFQSAAKENGLVLEGDYETNLPLLQADPDLLVRVLRNLIDNALRFAQSKVTVTAHKLGSRLRVSVVDDGPGIKPEHIPSLFDKYVQINRPSGGEGYQGTGLGLSICHEIIGLHGGKIWIESPEGEGARFHFSLSWRL